MQYRIVRACGPGTSSEPHTAADSASKVHALSAKPRHLPNAASFSTPRWLLRGSVQESSWQNGKVVVSRTFRNLTPSHCPQSKSAAFPPCRRVAPPGSLIALRAAPATATPATGRQPWRRRPQWRACCTRRRGCCGRALTAPAPRYASGVSYHVVKVVHYTTAACWSGRLPPAAQPIVMPVPITPQHQQAAPERMACAPARRNHLQPQSVTDIPGIRAALQAYRDYSAASVNSVSDTTATLSFAESEPEAWSSHGEAAAAAAAEAGGGGGGTPTTPITPGDSGDGGFMRLVPRAGEEVTSSLRTAHLLL